jgi:hypothetical protein
LNIWERIKYQVVKAAVEAYLNRKLGKVAVANTLVQDLITFVTTYLTTGDATIGPVSTSEVVDIAGQKITFTETVTIEAKKS